MSQEADREAEAKLFDELASCYEAIYTQYLQSVASFSSSGDLTCSMAPMPQKMATVTREHSRNMTDSLPTSVHTHSKTIVVIGFIGR